MKVPFRNDKYNLAKYDKIQISETTIMKSTNTGVYLLQNWLKKCNDKKQNVKIQNFVISTKQTTQRAYQEQLLHPKSVMGDAFMFVETSSNIHGNIVFVSWERVDIIQITNISFYCNRFSILTNDS